MVDLLDPRRYFEGSFFEELEKIATPVEGARPLGAFISDTFGCEPTPALRRWVDFLSTHRLDAGFGEFYVGEASSDELSPFHPETNANQFEALMEHGLGVWLLMAAFNDTICLGSTGSGDIWAFSVTAKSDGKSEVSLLDHDELGESHVVADSVEAFALARHFQKHGVRDPQALASLEGRIKSHNDADLEAGRTYESSLPSAGLCDAIGEMAYLLTGEWTEGSLTALPGEPGAALRDQLPGRALLWLWWLCLAGRDQELLGLLPVARQHRARLVRDSAELLEKILAGQRKIGPIEDITALRGRLEVST
jgi:hypothetical protein